MHYTLCFVFNMFITKNETRFFARTGYKVRALVIIHTKAIKNAETKRKGTKHDLHTNTKKGRIKKRKNINTKEERKKQKNNEK